MKYQVKNVVKAVLFSALIVLPFASAKAFVLEMDTEFSVADEPAGTAPWVTLTVENSTTADYVDFTIDASGLSGAEFISNFYFNYAFATSSSPLPILTGGDISDVSSFGMSFLPDSYAADGGGRYDYRINFPTASSENRFEMGDVVTFTLYGAGLTEDMFNVESAPFGDHGTWVAAAHIQGINTCTNPLCTVNEIDQGSGFISGGTGGTTVPEPGSLALLGMGLLGLGFVRRRKV